MSQAFADAVKRGYKMPSIPAQGIDTNAVTVLQDLSDPTVPIVIHVPNLYKSFSTTKFTYKKAEFDSLCDAMRKAIVDNKQLFYDACKSAVAAVNVNSAAPVVSQPVTQTAPVQVQPSSIQTKPVMVTPKIVAPTRQAVDPTMVDGNYPT
jgi:hypothetical protein